MEKKLEGNHTRMQRAILNKSWRLLPKGQQLYGYLPPIAKTFQVRQTRLAGHCWRRKDELITDILRWTHSHERAKAGWPARTYIQQLCTDTGCSPEDLPGAMYDRDGCLRRFREICNGSETWWWWWFLSDTNHYIQYYSFVCTQLDDLKYCYLTVLILFNTGKMVELLYLALIILFKFSHLFAHS